MSSGIGLILLAAGGSRRMGTPKQLLRDPEGVSLLRRAARAATTSDCHPIIVVLGGAAEESASELDGLPVETVVNSDWQAGMASSLKAGLTMLAANASPEAVIIMLCDQPMVTATLLNALITAHQDSGHDLVACEYGEIVGVPALFGHALFGALTSLQGDEGARHIVKGYAGPSSRIAFPGGSVDVDTVDDLKFLVQAGEWCLAAQAKPSAAAWQSDLD